MSGIQTLFCVENAVMVVVFMIITFVLIPNLPAHRFTKVGGIGLFFMTSFTHLQILVLTVQGGEYVWQHISESVAMQFIFLPRMIFAVLFGIGLFLDMRNFKVVSHKRREVNDALEQAVAKTKDALG